MPTVSFVPNGTFFRLQIRSLQLVLSEKQTLYHKVLSDTPEIRSLKPRLDRGEARALSFSKECQSLWLYLPMKNHHASIPAQGIAVYEAPALIKLSHTQNTHTHTKHTHTQDASAKSH